MSYAAFSIADYLGELAALATAGCWTLSALAHTESARRVGPMAMNFLRLVIASIFAAAFGWIVRGLPVPTDATLHNWLWLGLSGVVGLLLGDMCLFRAFVQIGPRVTLVLMSLVPPISAVLGWAILGERMSALAILGMALTVTGVALVARERQPPSPAGWKSVSWSGLLLGLGAAVGQAVGIILSKVGMAGYDAFASTQIRMLAAVAGFAVLFCALRAWPKFLTALGNRSGLGFAGLGAFFGPFLGVSLSLVAIKHTDVGIATTIMSIVPILLIPVVIVIYRERVSLRAVVGAVLAVVGVALLFL